MPEKYCERCKKKAAPNVWFCKRCGHGFAINGQKHPNVDLKKLRAMSETQQKAFLEQQKSLAGFKRLVGERIERISEKHYAGTWRVYISACKTYKLLYKTVFMQVRIPTDERWTIQIKKNGTWVPVHDAFPSAKKARAYIKRLEKDK